MAQNTVLAYGRDLTHYRAWADDGKLANYLQPSLSELSRYIMHLREQGVSAGQRGPQSRGAQDVLSLLEAGGKGRRQRYRFAQRPSLWERIPHVLSPESIEKLLAAPQAGERFFLRDRALLETLYATGSRASEVVNLETRNLFLDSGFCKCLGKGGKERVIPLGRPAQNALRTYLAEQRPDLTHGSDTVPWVFVSRGGRALTREMLWVLVKKYVKRAGLGTHAVRTRSVTVLPRICWLAGLTCEPCKNCWATPTSARRSITRTSTAIACATFTNAFIRGASSTQVAADREGHEPGFLDIFPGPRRWGSFFQNLRNVGKNGFLGSQGGLPQEIDAG